MSKFERFLDEIAAIADGHGRSIESGRALHKGFTRQESDRVLTKAREPNPSLQKSLAQMKRLASSISESLVSKEDKKKLAKQSRIDHQRIVLSKLGDMREQIKQSVIAGELSADETASLETRLNAETSRLYDKHLASLSEAGKRKIEVAPAGGIQ